MTLVRMWGQPSLHDTRNILLNVELEFATNASIRVYFIAFHANALSLQRAIGDSRIRHAYWFIVIAFDIYCFGCKSSRVQVFIYIEFVSIRSQYQVCSLLYVPTISATHRSECARCGQLEYRSGKLQFVSFIAAIEVATWWNFKLVAERNFCAWHENFMVLWFVFEQFFGPCDMSYKSTYCTL